MLTPATAVFPEDKEGFERELLAQAAELHNNRAGAVLDVSLLRQGAAFYSVSETDSLDFRSAMEQLVGGGAAEHTGPASRPPPLV